MAYESLYPGEEVVVEGCWSQSWLGGYSRRPAQSAALRTQRHFHLAEAVLAGVVEEYMGLYRETCVGVLVECRLELVSRSLLAGKVTGLGDLVGGLAAVAGLERRVLGDL